MNQSIYADKVWRQMLVDHSGQWGMDINHWDWVPGVGVISMLEYYSSNQRKEVVDYLVDWVQRNKEKAGGVKVINSIAPYAIFPALHRLTGEDWYREEAEKVANWLIEEAPRTREQAFEHTVTENAVFSEQVWADTIFMAVLFLARTAALLKNVRFAQEAQEQVLIHLRLLQDGETGVLFHGWNCESGDHMSAARWTRANAWIAAGIPMILDELADLIPIEQELTLRYERLLEGLLRYQQEDGLWSTVMDQPHFYREVSGSAGIGLGLSRALRQGWLKPSEQRRMAVERITAAVLPHITEEGVVGSVSGGTPVLASVAAYNEVPIYPALYGQGLVLMLLSEPLRGDNGEE